MSPLGLGVVFAIPVSIITSVISTSYSGKLLWTWNRLVCTMLRCDAAGKKKLKKSFSRKSDLFFWKERQAIPSHQMSLGSYPHNLERSALASEPVPNFSSNIVETHQRWIPRVTHSVVQPHAPGCLLCRSTRWDYLNDLSSQGRNWFTCSLNTTKDWNASRVIFFFFSRYLVCSSYFNYLRNMWSITC